MANTSPSPSTSPPTTSTSDSASRPGPIPHPSAKKACDNCRLRKTRCDFNSPCTNCASRGFECTYATPHRKRGPAGRRLNEIREREQQRTKSAESPHLSCPAAAAAAATAATAASSYGAAVPICAQHHPHPEQHQQHFVLPRDGGDMAVGDEQAIASTMTWEGLLDPMSSASPSFGGPPSSSVQRADTTTSRALEQALFASSNVSEQGPSSNGLEVRGGSYSAASVHVGSPGSNTNGLWPSVITDENLIRWLDIYFERLYPTLPVLRRSTVFARLLAHEHHSNPDFGAMLLSLSAFALIQPVRVSEQQASPASRQQIVNLLLIEAVKMRAAVTFGQDPTLDMIFTSIFLFACLFQKEQHNAAWLRLREAVELGLLYGLDDFDTYVNCGPEKKQQRLRVYYLLVITERAYGIERHHSIGFLGHPSAQTKGLLETISSAADSVDTTGIVIHDDAEGMCMLGLLQLIRLFDAIDEDFLRCWNGQCRNDFGGCRFLCDQTAIRIHKQITCQKLFATGGQTTEASAPTPRVPQEDSPLPTTPPTTDAPAPAWLLSANLTPSQEADILINQQWLQNRLWHLCLLHKLLVPKSDHAVLCIYNAIAIAERTLQICQRTPLSSIEVHGVGLIEKLYSIVESAVAAIRYCETAQEWPESVQADGNAGKSPRISENSREDLVGIGAPQRGNGEMWTRDTAVGCLHTGHIHHHRALLVGFFKLFKAIRAGEHKILARYSALVGQDLGL